MGAFTKDDRNRALAAIGETEAHFTPPPAGIKVHPAEVKIYPAG
jgi:hypothetical protein